LLDRSGIANKTRREWVTIPASKYPTMVGGTIQQAITPPMNALTIAMTILISIVTSCNFILGE
jgi:hypothetical protein